MTPELAAEIKAYCARRDAMLLKDSVDELIAFHEAEGLHCYTHRQVAEIALRKAQSAITTLPSDLRRRASEWLKERGYESWADAKVHN